MTDRYDDERLPAGLDRLAIARISATEVEADKVFSRRAVEDPDGAIEDYARAVYFCKVHEVLQAAFASPCSWDAVEIETWMHEEISALAAELDASLLEFADTIIADQRWDAALTALKTAYPAVLRKHLKIRIAEMESLICTGGPSGTFKAILADLIAKQRALPPEPIQSRPMDTAVVEEEQRRWQGEPGIVVKGEHHSSGSDGPPVSLSERRRAFMSRRGVSMGQLQRDAVLDRNTVRRWREGRGSDPETIKALARAFGVDPQEMP